MLMTDIIGSQQIAKLHGNNDIDHKALEIHPVAHMYAFLCSVVGREGEGKERVISRMQQPLAFVRFDPAEKIQQSIFHGYFGFLFVNRSVRT